MSKAHTEVTLFFNVLDVLIVQNWGHACPIESIACTYEAVAHWMKRMR